jgi:Protein involved in biosynthesis of mitomycin antibiotics/polyketide fumonisin
VILFQFLKKNGVVLLKNMIENKWQRIILDAIEEDIKKPSPFFHAYKTEEGKGNFHGNLRIWQHYQGLKDYCLNSPLPYFAAQLLNSNKINLFYDQLFVKEPETNNRIRWHNDQPYWPIRGWPVISFWTSLDPISKENGPMEFIRKSHKWGKWYQPEHFAPGASKAYEQNPEFEKIPDIESNRDKYDIISFDMNPGDLLAFHALVVHGSAGNISKDRRRRGYAVRYTGNDVFMYRKGITPRSKKS